MRNYVKTIFCVLVLSLFVCNEAIAFWEKNSSQDEETVLPAESLRRLTTVITNIKRYYYKKIDISSLLDGAIKGMLAGLDPHSEYLGPEDLKELAMETSGKFGGIGILMVPDQGVIKVITPIDDTPAYRAGIKAGDYILQINNKLVRDMTPSEYVSMMRGPKGSKLNLTILHKNENKPRVVTLRREIIRTKSVKDAKLLEPGYGYVRLAIFQEATEKDLVKTIRKLQIMSRGNLKGLILDMRSNPGGLFDSAVDIANDFLDASKLKSNKLIVYTKGQDEEDQITATATPGELLPNVPLVVLINEGSASAAEIVAGALQDHKRAIIVGTRSFGKGSVQTVLPISRGNAIKLTTALYYTPLGRSIQAKGIEPDIDVEDIQVSHQGAQSLPRVDESALMDHIQNADGDYDGTDGTPTLGSQQKRSRSELELVYKDYQLYEALHTLKTFNVMKSKSSQG